MLHTVSRVSFLGCLLGMGRCVTTPVAASHLASFDALPYGCSNRLL